MITINFECFIPVTYYFQFHRIVATGETREEVIEDAKQQCEKVNGVDLKAVGLSNTRHNWEAVFGPTSYEDSSFGAK